MSHPWFLQISWAWLGLSHQSTLPLLAALGDHAHITEQGEHVETKLVEVCTVSKHHGEKGGGFYSGLCCIVPGPNATIISETIITRLGFEMFSLEDGWVVGWFGRMGGWLDGWFGWLGGWWMDGNLMRQDLARTVLKFVVVGGWWLSPVLVFSLSLNQA